MGFPYYSCRCPAMPSRKWFAQYLSLTSCTRSSCCTSDWTRSVSPCLGVCTFRLRMQCYAFQVHLLENGNFSSVLWSFSGIDELKCIAWTESESIKKARWILLVICCELEAKPVGLCSHRALAISILNLYVAHTIVYLNVSQTQSVVVSTAGLNDHVSVS